MNGVHVTHEAPHPDIIEPIPTYGLPLGDDAYRKIKHYIDLRIMRCKYETRWEEREQYCDEVEKVYTVRMENHVQHMHSTGCTNDAINEYIVNRTEEILVKRISYLGILMKYTIDLKAMSLDYYINVVKKIR